MRRYFTLVALALALLLAAVVLNLTQRKSFSEETVAATIATNLSHEMDVLKREWEVLPRTKWSLLQHPFFEIDERGRIVEWSKTYPAIDVQDCIGDFEWKLIQSSRSDLLVNKRSLNGHNIIGVINLRDGYDLVNQYLSASWNRGIFPFDHVRILNAQSQGGSAVGVGQEVFFKIKLEKESFIESRPSVFFASMAVLVLMTLIFWVTADLHRAGKPTYGFVILFSTLATVRIAMVQFSFPSQWIYSKYFDPKYFASSSFNASVGDFLLNSLIVAVACAYFVSVYPRTELVRLSLRQSKLNRFVIATLFSTAAYFSFLFPYLFVESIFHDSSIPFDISSSAKFDGVRIAALAAFGFGCISSFCFVHSFLRIAKALLPVKDLILNITIAAIIFTSYFVFSELNYWPTLIIGTIYFLLLVFSRYYVAVARMGYRAFPYLLIVIMAYAIQGAWGVRRFSEERKLRAMFRSATNLVSNDVLGEYLLNQASQKISTDLFLLASVESPLLSKNLARQKVKQVYLSEYLDRYEMTISFYHADGSPADAQSSLDFATSIEAFQNEADKTNYDWIYQIRTSNSESLKRYLAIVPLRKHNSVRGYIVLDLSLKRMVPQQVYPELLYDNRFAQSIRNRDFSYAVFVNSKVIDRNGNFNFERELDLSILTDSKLYTTGMKVGDQWIAAAEGDGGRRIVLAAEEYPWLNVLANFSFFFVLGILLIFSALSYYLMRHLFYRRELNYSARIQLFIYLSFILPLLAVSAIAIRMISQSNDKQTEREIEAKGISIGESLLPWLDTVNLDSLGWTSEIRRRTLELAQATGLDANLYDVNGELISSSQQRIFSNRLLAALVDRSAWEKIVQENYSVSRSQQKIGSLAYNSSFFAIRSPKTGKLLGILELPFFNSATDGLKSSILSNILITFTGVFILFSLFASSAIGKLTSPLRFIAKKLNATSLAGNQPIAWKSNDEIGSMVKEYNRMLSKLEQSKIELSRSEKESAWREIAKQVAHEIKNPLTPMKLTLQQMERTMAQGELSRERAENALKTLLSQVDILNGIAGSFSAFATMPLPEISSVELNTVLKRTVSLFEGHVLGNVRLNALSAFVHVRADEKLLGRIFSNVILNGLQSGQAKKIEVEVSTVVDGDSAIVCFKDNGSGVASDLRDKIFLPHFSTKETGSGLGLAIAKQGIEQMGGQIWFETSPLGTSFFISLKIC